MAAISQKSVIKREDLQEHALHPAGLLRLPAEVLLHILSYLDLPELAMLARMSHLLALLSSDPILHFKRLWVVSPSRVNHHLFGTSPNGRLLRPTVGDLVQRGIMRGLGLERRWRRGLYLYSLDSTLQYEKGLELLKRHTQYVVASHLKKRIKLDAQRNKSGGSVTTTTLLDIESSSPFVARSLLPIMRKLKWCLRRDNLARELKNSGKAGGEFSLWLAGHDGQGNGDKENTNSALRGNVAQDEKKRTRMRVFVEGEQLRLAVCPGVKKRVGFYEKLGRKA